MTQLGHSKLETTQIYAAAVSERRRATVLAMEFGGSSILGEAARARLSSPRGERCPTQAVASGVWRTPE